MNLSPSTPEDSKPLHKSSSAPARRSELRLSFVVFVEHPDAELRSFFQSLEDSVRSLKNSWEVICIDNTSSEETWDTLKSIQMDNRSRIHLLRFRSVQKRSRAIDAALVRVTGDVVYTLHADAPEEIQAVVPMLNRLEEGYDVVLGERQEAEPPSCWERWIRGIFNTALYRVTNLRLRSPLTEFLCFRANVPRLMGTNGEKFDLLPYSATHAGFEVTELPWQAPAAKPSEKARNPFAQVSPYMEKLTSCIWAEYRASSFLEASTPAFAVLVCGALFVTVSPFVGLGFQIAFLAAGFLLITAALCAMQFFSAASICDIHAFHHRDRLHEAAVADERFRVGTAMNESESAKPESEKLTSNGLGQVSVKTGEARARVLIVDDDPMIQKLLSGILGDADCQIEVACDGEEGLNKVTEETDVILLDLAMPRMDGFEFLKKFRSTSYDAKIIVISGAGRVKNVSRAFKEGAFDFLEKPFEISETVRMVHNAVNQRRLSREYLNVA